MGLLKRERSAALSVQTRAKQSYNLPIYSAERELYKALRASIPIIDAAIYKLRRLLGEFKVSCWDEQANVELENFLRTVKVNAMSAGVDDFIGIYFEELLTYGTAAGEMVLSGQEIAALYNATLEDLDIEEVSPLETRISRVEFGSKIPCEYPQLIFLTAINSEAGMVKGNSVLKGLPFVSEILLKIYKTIGTNWDRLGNTRFAVTCKADSSGMYAGEKAKQIAGEWQRAMHSREVSDFIAVGDVSIKAIGADNQILESEVPVRQMLEQIVAKLGIPPFLLGLSWSSTERMSSQQSDILTSEIDGYRRMLTPVVLKLCNMWLTLNGYERGCSVDWNDITLQDELDHANAVYLKAQARALDRQAEDFKEQTGEE